MPRFRPYPARAASKHFQPHRKFSQAVLSEGGERAHRGPSRTAEVVQARGEAETWLLGSPGRWCRSPLAQRERGLALGLGIQVRRGKAEGHWVIVGWRGQCGPGVVITHLTGHVMCARHSLSALHASWNPCRPHLPEEPWLHGGRDLQGSSRSGSRHQDSSPTGLHSDAVPRECFMGTSLVLAATHQVPDPPPPSRLLGTDLQCWVGRAGIWP